MISRGLHILLIASTLVAVGLLSLAPPSTVEGFSIGNPAAGVKFGVYLDLHCPDAGDFFAALLRAKDTLIGGRPLSSYIDMRIHLFPLPFLHNSFLASVVAKYIELYHPERYLSFLQRQFDNMAKYKANAVDKTQREVQSMLIEDAIAVMDGVEDQHLTDIFGNEKIDSMARSSFKFGSYAGVTGTPSLVLNGVFIDRTFDTAESLADYLAGYAKVQESLSATERSNEL